MGKSAQERERCFWQRPSVCTPFRQKKRVVAVARKESITAASKYFKIPRTSINQWMVGAAISTTSVLREEIGKVKADGWVMIKLSRISCSPRFSNLVTCIPSQQADIKTKAMELIGPSCPSFKV